MLDKIISKEEDKGKFIHDSLINWRNGAIKLYTIYKVLKVRMQNADVFLEGDYLPLEVCGDKEQNVLAFVRRLGGRWVVAVVPKFASHLVKTGQWPLREQIWGNTHICLPEDAPDNWLQIFDGDSIMTSQSENKLTLSRLFNKFPVSLLLNV
jgi:(1->4)-alpha-D-glucan 1-alpha-D-glucosylmutase